MNEALVVMVRGVIGFLSLLIFARTLGKEQISQLTFFDYVLGITIGSIAASLTTDLSSRAWPHWVGLATWVVSGLIVQWASIKWHYASKYIGGEPVILIMDGRIMEDAMRKMRFRLTDLLEQLREKDVFDLTQVAYAVLERDGKLSVLKKPEYQPVTLSDLNISSKSVGISTELIYDGLVLDQNLRQVKRDRVWLNQELAQHGISHPSEVFLASLDPSGKLYIDSYKDHVSITDIGDYPGLN